MDSNKINTILSGRRIAFVNLWLQPPSYFRVGAIIVIEVMKEIIVCGRHRLRSKYFFVMTTMVIEEY